MKVHPSALKHGVSSQDAIQAAEWSLWIEPLDEDVALPTESCTSASTCRSGRDWHSGAPDLDLPFCREGCRRVTR